MIPFYGSVAASSTLYMPWHSFAAATGASSATTGFAAADVKIYKDGSTTERSSAAGITVAADFDSRTGINLATIDLSDNTDAGFYAAGSQYAVCVDTVTIDSQTVRFWLGTFRIGVQPVNMTQILGTAVSSPATAGILDVNVKNMNNVAGTAITTVKAVQGLTTADTIVTYTGNTVQTGDAYARLGAPAGASHAADVAAVKVDTAAIKTKTDNLPSDPADASDVAGAFSTVNSTLSTIAGYIDTEVAAIKAKTDNLPGAPAATSDIPSANTIADALLDRSAGVETGLTPRQFFRLAASVLFGKASGLATSTAVYRDFGDTKDRISATVDADGNRSALTRDAA